METENFNSQYIEGDNATIRNLVVTNSFTNNSDRRLKTNIKKLGNDYTSLVKDIQPVTFRYKDSEEERLGFIAQNVEKAFLSKNLVNAPTRKNNAGIYSLDYMQLIPILWKTVQEQQILIENMQKEISVLKEEK